MAQITPAEAAPMVDWSEIKMENVFLLSPANKQSKDGKVHYKEVSVLYNYGTPDAKRVDGLYMQLPLMTSTGIKIKKEDNKDYSTKSMMFTYDLNKPDHKGVIEVSRDLHLRIATLLMPIKGQIGIMGFNASSNELAEATGFKGFVYMPKDKATSEIIEGKNPTQWFKLNNGTAFTDLKGNKIDHNVLIDKEITGFPLIHYSHLYASGTGKASMQAKVASMVVLSVKPAGSQTRQLSTIQRLIDENPDAQISLEQQLAALMGDSSDSAHKPDETQTHAHTQTHSHSQSQNHTPSQPSSDIKSESGSTQHQQPPQQQQPQHQQPQHQQQQYSPTPSPQQAPSQQIPQNHQQVPAQRTSPHSDMQQGYSFPPIQQQMPQIPHMQPTQPQSTGFNEFMSQASSRPVNTQPVLNLS